MNTIQTKIGTLAFAECEKFIRQSLASSITAFLSSQKDGMSISDISGEAVTKFVEDFSPQPVKATAKRSDSKSAWQGFSKQYRLDHPGCKAKAVGTAWNKGKDVSKEDWARFVEIGNAPKAEKVRAVSTGNAWTGFRSEFSRRNADKEMDDDTKLEKGQLTTAASTEWKRIKKSLTAKEIKNYQKIANKIKSDKAKAEKKKEALREKREAKAAEKKAKAAEKAQAEKNSGSDSDSDDDKALGDDDSDSDDSGDEF